MKAIDKPVGNALEKSLLDFWGFVAERQRIYAKKSAGELAPWTADEVLQKYHFCNIYRAADPGSQYFADNRSEDLEECYFQAVFYRMLNNRKVFEKLGGLPDFSNAYEYGQKLKALAAKQPVFSKAYRTLCNIPEGSRRHEVLVGYIQEWADENYTEKMAYDLLTAKSPKDIFTLVNGSWKFIGDFLAFQIMLDLLTHPHFHQLAEDDSWTLAGPGACAGVLALSGKYNSEWESFRDKRKRAKITEFIIHMHKEQRQYLPQDFLLYDNRWPNVHDIESCFCEYGKYKKLQLQKPTAKRFYYSSTHAWKS